MSIAQKNKQVGWNKGIKLEHMIIVINFMYFYT